MTFTGYLTELATVLRVQQQLFEDNTFTTMTAEIYKNCATVLDGGRKTCKAELAAGKLPEPTQVTVTAITGEMEELSDIVKALAVAREGYVPPQGAGSVGPGLADLEAARSPHASVRHRLDELAGDVETAASSAARHPGAANSSQQTAEERPYRAVVTRMEGEYRRGLRRSG